MSFGNSNFEKKGSGRSVGEEFDERFGLGGDDGFVPQRSKYAAKKAKKRDRQHIATATSSGANADSYDISSLQQKKLHIGVIIGFNSQYGKGCIRTNKLGYEDCILDRVEPRFKEENCLYRNPREGDLVIFCKKYDTAVKVRKFSVCYADVMVALRYAAQMPFIPPADRSQVKEYHILDLLCRQMRTGGEDDGVVREAIDDWLAAEVEAGRNAIVSKWWQNANVRELMRRLYLPSKQYVSSRMEIEVEIGQQLVELIASKSVNEFRTIPAWCRVTVAPEIARGFLDAAKNEFEAEMLLNFIGRDSAARIYDSSDALLPWMRRLTLRRVTNDAKWIQRLNLSQWSEIRTWLSETNSTSRTSVIWDFAEDADVERINKVWCDIFEDERVIALLVRRIVDDAHGRAKRGALVTKVAGSCTREPYLKHWCALFVAGVDLSVSYEAMADSLTALADAGVDKIEQFCKEFDAACGQDRAVEFIKGLPKFTPDLLCALFAITGNAEFLSSITDLNAVRTWLSNRSAKDLLRFVKRYAAAELTSFDEKEDILFSKFDAESFAAAIRLVPEEEQYLLLQHFPRTYVLAVAVSQFAGTQLCEQIVKEEWERIWSELPYAVIDLETDGENIREFALIADRGNESYEGEAQLRLLLRALKRQEIVVGHNIKKWDLPVLAKKGYAGTAFVWDTLEIEILLNPCRYAYSLHTTHVARGDVDLTNRLFRNQMWRLAKDERLCDRLRDYLPQQIKEMLAKLKQPYFVPLFEQSDERFFNELRDVDSGIIKTLTKVAEGATSGETLIVAPRELWGCVAKYVPVEFPEVDSGIEYFPVRVDKISQSGIAKGYPQMVLERFAESSPTPIVANLPHYLRIQYFPDEQLGQVISQNRSPVKCVDVAALDGSIARAHYDRIFVLGCEFGNRIDQHVLDGELAASDFLEKKVSVPLRLASAGYTAFVRNGQIDEYREMALDELPKEARSVWVERRLDGKYRVCYNFDCTEKIESFLRGHADATIERTPWTFEDTDEGTRKIFLVRSVEPKKSDGIRECRVGFASRLRANYWCYQLKLLKAVAEKEADKPIVYILENDLELDAVRALAKEYGFDSPQCGGLIKRVEAIQRRHNSLLVISQEDFRNVVNLRTDEPLCFVWDGMAVDKCRMMWQGQMPFGDEKRDPGGEDRLRKVDPTIDTPRSVLLAAWPMYEYFYRFIVANCAASAMYVLDPYFDDYNDLGDLWHVEIFSRRLWESKAAYDQDLGTVRKYFKSTGKLNGWLTEAAYGTPEVAMKTIRDVFIPGHDWHPYQRDILPQILSRKTNCLISIPTGGGKSILFQGPALYNSMLTNRLSIVITPLKALMEDQVLGLQRKGFYSNVDYINGDRSAQEIQQIYRKVAGGEIALLYVAPERFRSHSFVNALLTRITNDGGWEYFIFDEAHCVSQWGQEFRPEYLHAIRKCAEWQKEFPDSCVALYSATVTRQIEEDIRGFIGNLERMGQSEEDYNPIRNHIGMSFVAVEHRDEARVTAIAQYITDKRIDVAKSRMLVFCRTRKQTEETAAALSASLPEFGSSAIGYFHAGMDADERNESYERFRKGEISILCATKAFGMGMDIPNVHYIVHYSPPSVLEDYLQEVGRAGRDRAMYEAVGFGPENRIPAVCLFSKEDFKKAKEMIKKGNLSWQEVIDINKKIQEYIQKIQTLEQTKDVPVVIPNTLWHKEEFEDDATAFKIGMYWLERLGRIRMGYMSPAHLDVALRVSEVDETAAVYTTRRGQKVLSVIKFIGERAKWEKEKTVQVSLTELRRQGKMSRTAAMDSLVKAVKQGVLELRRPVMCRVANTRRSEVAYMFREGRVDNHYALHIVFETVRQLLAPIQQRQMRKETLITIDDRNAAIDKVFEQAGIEIKQDGDKRYMPWWERGKGEDNSGLSLESSYGKDLKKKRAKHVFTLIEMLPGIKYRSELNVMTRNVQQLVTIQETGWEKYLNDLEADCLRLLKSVNDNTTTYSMDWAKTMAELELDDKGFAYFEDLVRVLRILGYIVCGSLLPFGIEVYAGEKVADELQESPKDASADGEIKEDFDRIARMRDIRLAAMGTFSHIEKSEASKFIGEYFQCVTTDAFHRLLLNYNDENSPDMAALREEAIKREEERLGEEQKVIYNADVSKNINVIAGPGSGKTHILTLRCAKLIYRENVAPERILALAYNRAVVVELRNRLDRIFSALGLSKSASHLHVCTFHALAKRICGAELEGLDMKEWEKHLLDKMRNNPNAIRHMLGDIRYIMIDEFQDITQTRLNAMLEFKKIYPAVSFFTIGDKNQSIYGFDKKIPGIPQSTSPDYYYQQLDKAFKPQTLYMGTNYRSYQKILDAASVFLPPGTRAHLPKSAPGLVENEPKDQYVFLNDVATDGDEWFHEFDGVIQEAEQKGFRDVAVFFRTNAEVYHGYSLLKGMAYPHVRLRVQGASSCELWRTREVSTLLRWLDNNGDDKIEIANSATQKRVREYVEKVMRLRPAYDMFYLDFAYTLVLNFLDFVATEDRTYTLADLADELREECGRDDSQLYKIYDRYREKRIITDDKINVVLTTMHKVKGLEFDSVVITPGHAALPLKYDGTLPLSADTIQELEEEKRLMFVAYTRAKKALRAYRGERERKLQKMQCWEGDESSLGYHDNPGLEKLYLSYLALERRYEETDFVKTRVVKNGAIVVRPFYRDGECKCLLVYEGHPIGFLSLNSRLRGRIRNEHLERPLEGFFVNEVFVWNYEDSVSYDQAHNTTFSQTWCAAARQRGFIYLVDFAGFGH